MIGRDFILMHILQSQSWVLVIVKLGFLNSIRYEQVFFDPIPIEVDEEGDKPKGSRPER